MSCNSEGCSCSSQVSMRKGKLSDTLRIVEDELHVTINRLPWFFGQSLANKLLSLQGLVAAVRMTLVSEGR